MPVAHDRRLLTIILNAEQPVNGGDQYLTGRGWQLLTEGGTVYAPYLWRDPSDGRRHSLTTAFEIQLARDSR